MSSSTSLPARAGAFMEGIRARFGIPGSVLKTLAVVSMLVDHAGATVFSSLARYPQIALTAPARARLVWVMRRFGRLAFPIFCFLLVEGFLHTRDVRKYALRLFVFALISEPCFDFCLHYRQPLMNKQNVYFTLLIGLLVLWGVREWKGRVVLQLMLMVSGMLLARLLKTDYSYRGVFIIEMLYITRFSKLTQSLCGAAYMQWYEKMPTPLAFIPVYLYNGKRGRQIRYFFYAFYPGHLLILGLLNNYLLPALLT